MTAIWLLSTRGRPDACQEVLDACKATGMSSPGVVYVDETVDEYRSLKLPSNWTVHHEPVWGSLGASMRWCFDRYPNASQYGWLADDTYPRTNGWDRLLETEAGRWNVSYANDLWMSEEPIRRGEFEIGDNLSSGLCWGGDLVRTVGWWATPGLVQAGIDTAWCALIASLGLGRYRHDIVVEHKNYRTGKRPKDGVDDWDRDGVDYVTADIIARNRWVASPDFRRVLSRVAAVTKVELTPWRMGRLRQQIRDSYATQFWSPGMPGARLQRVLEEIDSDLDRYVAEVLDPDTDAEPAGAVEPVHPVGHQSVLHRLGADRLQRRGRPG